MAQLAPGDILLFSRNTAASWILKIKTWSPYTHVEVVGEDGTTYASRDGIGCGHYPINLDGLAKILRPPTFNFASAKDWFETNRIDEQGYDWLGLINFFYARLVGKENGRMFCSEFATRFLREGGWDPFPGVDADTVAPRDFTLIGMKEVV